MVGHRTSNQRVPMILLPPRYEDLHILRATDFHVMRYTSQTSNPIHAMIDFGMCLADGVISLKDKNVAHITIV